jgi:hypothetical protein
VIIQFESSKLKYKNKKGILKPDADGYYDVVVGGLNVYNSANEYYTLEEAKELFNKSSRFMQRVEGGYLKSEVGHPAWKTGQNFTDYLRRILTIDDQNICGHFKTVWLDPDFGKNNTDLGNNKAVGIMAKVRPTGIHAAVLESAINNPHENLSFSIRAITTDTRENGQTYRALKTIVTFDLVNEPGIKFANKFDNPSLENINEDDSESIGINVEDKVTILESEIQRIASNLNGVSTESKSMVSEILDLLKQNDRKQVKPKYLNW